MRTLVFLVVLSSLAFSQPTVKAPAFTLKNLAGDTVSLLHYCGKPVFIDFWVMWCETCQEEVPKIQKLYDAYKDKGVVFLGIHCGEKDAEKVNVFVKKAGIGYAVLNDPEDTVSNVYNIKGTPAGVIVDTAGAIIKTFREIDNRREKEIRRILDSQVK